MACVLVLVVLHVQVDCLAPEQQAAGPGRQHTQQDGHGAQTLGLLHAELLTQLADAEVPIEGHLQGVQRCEVS